MANGASVSAWTDRTNNFAFSATNPPEYVTSGDFPIVQFVAGSSEAMVASTAITPLAPVTIMMVAAFPALSGSNAGIVSVGVQGAGAEYNTANGYTFFYPGANQMSFIHQNVQMNGQVNVPNDSTYRCVTLRVGASGGRNLLVSRMADGTTYAAGGSLVAAAAGTPDRTVIGGRFNNGIAGAYVSIDLAQLLMWNRVLTDVEVVRTTELLRRQFRFT